MQSSQLATAHSVCLHDRRTDNARYTRRSEQGFARDSLLRPGEEPPLASHLTTPRAFYTHHGIYVGNGRVIHYSGLALWMEARSGGKRSSRAFRPWPQHRLRRDVRRLFDPRAVVERARSRLGERGYRLLTNNCEHFCAWALRDEGASQLSGRPTSLRSARDLRRYHLSLRSWWQIQSEAA